MSARMTRRGTSSSSLSSDMCMSVQGAASAQVLMRWPLHMIMSSKLLPGEMREILMVPVSDFPSYLLVMSDAEPEALRCTSIPVFCTTDSNLYLLLLMVWRSSVVVLV